MSHIPPAPLMLSISGLRGIVGESLTPIVAAKYGAALGSYFIQTRGEKPCVVVGRDSRPSGEMIENAVVSGLSACGCRVVRLGVLSTPGVAAMVKHLEADGGVILTASHNPTPWNGIKCLRHDAVAPPKEEAETIVARFKEENFYFNDATGIPASSANPAGVAAHIEKVLTFVDVEAIKAAKLRVVVDATHGAGGPEAQLLLKKLGVALVPMWLEPTGRFPHTPEPTKENLTALSEKVAKENAACGFALDPDADRLAIVDETGAYIGEEYTLALCVLHKLEQGGTVVANLSSSRMVDDIANKKGGKALRAAVGEANVAQVMRDSGAKIGGEGNGGLMFPAISQVRDSFLAMAFVLEMLAKRKLALSAIVSEIPAYAIVKDKAPVDPAVIAKLAAVLPGAFPGAKVDARDGVRLDVGNTWVHVRASNTEPIVRLIAEAPTEDEAKALIAQAKKALGM